MVGLLPKTELLQTLQGTSQCDLKPDHVLRPL